MQYGSSYAAGGTGARQMAYASAEPLPTPKPARLHWSTLLFGGGMVVCLVGLLVTLAGIPGSMGYDEDSPGVRNKPDSSDPLKVQQSLDQNMKWIDENSDSGSGHYVGLIKSINQSEAAIPAMVQGLAAMAGSVATIDSELGEVYATSQSLGTDMEAMTAGSAKSAATMQAMSTSVGGLGRSMEELADATEVLTARMGSIQGKASGIANGGIGDALEATRGMNAALPAEVPVPKMEGGAAAPSAVVTGGGAGTGASMSMYESAYLRGELE